MVVCQVLGAVSVDGRTVSSARQRGLLAALVMGRGAVVSCDRLVDVVWEGQPPPSALNALQTYVSRLRSLLGTDAVAWRPPGYALALPVEAVDAWRFEALVDAARHRGPGEALAVLDEALGLWRGAAYAEFADAEFARAEAVRLEELRASAEVARLDALLGVGRAPEVVAASVRLIDRDPYREALWERRMRALHGTGRTVDAVRVFHEYRTMLADETGLEPSADLAALERALVASPPSQEPTTMPLASTLLPTPVTSFVGREDARDELVQQLATQRVITLLGPAGVGKTRLGIEVARAYEKVNAEPVWFVELVSLGSAGVTQAVHRTLGLADGSEPITGLRRALADRPGLLVLDNCEHVVEAAAVLVEALVPFCPNLRVVATSRRRLGLPAERLWPVPPLAVPDSAGVERAAELLDYAATRLFLDRLEASGVAFDDEAGSGPVVAAICAAVDGLPLGIELAAALARELPLDRVADGLAVDNAGAARGDGAARHRSLDAAIAWGYDLLTPGAQRVLRRLAVFEGGWTVDAAEAVCAGHGIDIEHVPSLLAELAGASFVTFDPSVRRYAMLDTLHSFARARLSASDESAVRDAHLAWCRRLTAAAAPLLRSLTAAEHIRRVEIELPNVRAALWWAVADGDRLADAERLALDVEPLWSALGASREAVEWVDRILERPAPTTVERVELGVAAANHRGFMGDWPGCRRQAEQALTLARTLDDSRTVCRCLVASAFATIEDGGMDRACEARAIAAEIGDSDLESEALAMLGLCAMTAGRGADAVAFYERSLATGSAAGHHGTRAMLAFTYEVLGQFDEARRQLLVAEEERAETGQRPFDICLSLARLELGAGDVDAAQRAYERAVVWGSPSDNYPADQMRFEATSALLRAEAGDLAGTAVTARRVAAVPTDISAHSDACQAWLMAGEVLFRAGDLGDARRCFTNVLCQRAGAYPAYRTPALTGVAATLTSDAAHGLAIDLAATATAIAASTGFVAPRWLTAARFADDGSAGPGLSGEEAVALALASDDP